MGERSFSLLKILKKEKKRWILFSIKQTVKQVFKAPLYFLKMKMKNLQFDSQHSV